MKPSDRVDDTIQDRWKRSSGLAPEPEAVYDAPTTPLQAVKPDGMHDAPTFPMRALGRIGDTLQRLRVARRPTHPESPKSSRGLQLLLLALILFSIVSLSIGGAVNAKNQLDQMRAIAHDGLQHLENVRAMVNPNKLDQALNSTTLNKVRDELSAAERDFGALRQALGQPQGTIGIASHLPWSGSLLSSASALAAAADEFCIAGIGMAQEGQLALQILQSGLFASEPTTSSGQNTNASAPQLDMPTYLQLRAGLTTALQHLQSAVAYARHADLSVLPSSLVKPQQVAEVRQLLASWPQIQTTIGQVNAALDILPKALGLGSPSKYLMELMDSTELRPGGGFVGNYAITTVVNGKIQPVTVTDTYLLDRPYLAKHGNFVQAPSQYPWWPFKTVYGLRDSNLSGDFPTSAQLAIQQLTREGGPTVQGVVAVTPAAIEGVIHILGPIPMPQYGQVVTDTNLEHLIHLYELVPSEQPLAPLPPGEQISSPEKRFTALLGKTLLQKLHNLSLAQQIAVGKQLLGSVRSKDIQIYLSDPEAEHLLSNLHLDGAFPHAPDDGVSIVDSNVTPSKGSPFLTVTSTDNVVVDSQGTSTHHLTLTYKYQVTNPAEVYGPSYYRTYLRVYAPGTAQLLSLQGFANINGDDQINHSDQPGYQMWGGYLILQNGTTHSLRISWQVPHAAIQGDDGRYTYVVDYTRQAGLQQVLNTTISVPGSSRPAYQFAGRLEGDKLITISFGG